jgi:hypothetical protein
VEGEEGEKGGDGGGTREDAGFPDGEVKGGLREGAVVDRKKAGGILLVDRTLPVAGCSRMEEGKGEGTAETTSVKRGKVSKRRGFR